jgi:23S rRNA (adenine-N6)-dimethyltransferase
VPAAGRARWGWHRLTPSWAERVVADAGVRPGDLVLDIGAGTGALTAPLLAAGARVVAIELHPARVATLRRRFARRDVTVVVADLVLQHGAARRWASGRAPGSGRWLADHDVGLGRRLPRHAFAPPPRVDCSVLVVRRAAATGLGGDGDAAGPRAGDGRAGGRGRDRPVNRRA